MSFEVRLDVDIEWRIYHFINEQLMCNSVKLQIEAVFYIFKFFCVALLLVLKEFNLCLIFNLSKVWSNDLDRIAIYSQVHRAIFQHFYYRNRVWWLNCCLKRENYVIYSKLYFLGITEEIPTMMYNTYWLSIQPGSVKQRPVFGQSQSRFKNTMIVSLGMT